MMNLHNRMKRGMNAVGAIHKGGSRLPRSSRTRLPSLYGGYRPARDGLQRSRDGLAALLRGQRRVKKARFADPAAAMAEAQRLTEAVRTGQRDINKAVVRAKMIRRHFGDFQEGDLRQYLNQIKRGASLHPELTGRGVKAARELLQKERDEMAEFLRAQRTAYRKIQRGRALDEREAEWYRDGDIRLPRSARSMGKRGYRNTDFV